VALKVAEWSILPGQFPTNETIRDDEDTERSTKTTIVSGSSEDIGGNDIGFERMQKERSIVGEDMAAWGID
jgi:hypothetical protein